VETEGPSGNFCAVLFIEKEGFDPILKAAQIANKYDVAIKSTKGMSVTAARELPDEMCSDHDIPLLLLHDFDKVGFSIAGTLQRDTRRYEFKNDITVVDIGLSKAAGLEVQSHLAKNMEASRQARVTRLWAERRLGRWLIDAGTKGHRYMGRPPKGVKIGNHDPDLLMLRKLGISEQESKDWQKIARLSHARFEALLAGKPGRCHLPHYRRHRGRRFGARTVSCCWATLVIR
jgi:hypothetical protein